ncbi:MAG: flavodoxin family protein [Planctomycetia bacterium]
MANSHPLILCKSVHHGNTAKVAKAMAGVLGAEIAAPEAVPYTSLQDRPLVGFGSGVYYGRMHDGLHEWLQGLPESPGAMTPAFVFSTSGLPRLAWFWHRPLRRLLARKGFHIVGEFSCGGHDTWGPLGLTGGLNRTHPDERDLERARAFAYAMERRIGPVEAAATCVHSG